MKRILLFSLPALAVILAAVLVLAARIPRAPARNPDPNHTHADFAVWIGGEKLDFSAQRYMMTEEKEQALEEGDPRRYTHLHDGIGTMIHRHKPGLMLQEFFQSLSGARYEGNVFSFTERTDGRPMTVRLFVNDVEREEGSVYVFSDLDRILLTDATEEAEVKRQLKALTDDACLYSKTCPWRGEPPTENCVADPAVPCVAP